MQKPSERHKFTSDNDIIKFKKPVHDPFKVKYKFKERLIFKDKHLLD